MRIHTRVPNIIARKEKTIDTLAELLIADLFLSVLDNDIDTIAMISAGSPIIQKQQRQENVLNTKPERISKTIPTSIKLKFKIMKVVQYMNNGYV